MALLNDILKWTEFLPDWQRDASRRLLQNESGLSEPDYAELYALLKKENEIEVGDIVAAVPLASEHLPTELTPGGTVKLLKLYELENVNQISIDHVLTFSKSGMTVIYGGNGSGKSGYARVMKKACRARDQSEPIHPDAKDPSAAKKVPTAKFEIMLAGKLEQVMWSRDTTPPDQLSKISVFDSKCARSYITAEMDVAYLPYGLDVVQNLANHVLPKLIEMLETELSGISVDKLPFEHLLGETEVGKVIKGLSANSDAKSVSELGTLSEEEEGRILELKQALKESDPLSKAREFRLSAVRLKTYAESLAKPLVWVNDEAVKKLQQLVVGQKVAEAAETKAAAALRAGEELLPGTGDLAWKSLFEAARRFAKVSAYPGEDFPWLTQESKVCPLCQEELEDIGIQRLNRFDEYIKNDVAKTAETARKRVDTAKGKIVNANLQILPDEALSDELNELDEFNAAMLRVA